MTGSGSLEKVPLDASIMIFRRELLQDLQPRSTISDMMRCSQDQKISRQRFFC